MSSLFGKGEEFKKAEDIDLKGTEKEINQATNVDDPKNAVAEEKAGHGEGTNTKA